VSGQVARGIGALGACVALVALGSAAGGGAATKPQLPRTWAGQATWKHETEDDSTFSSDVKRAETDYVATIRLTFGKAPRRYGALYVVKSGTLTWTVTGSTFDRLTGLAETTCSWKLSRSLRVGRYAGTIELTQNAGGYRGIFAADESYGAMVQAPGKCTTTYLSSHTPPVETRTLTYPEIAPNPLFMLSRKTAGLPAKGSPLVIGGSSRTSATTHPPGGGTITHRDTSTWSWRFTGRS
jgi:hypothetical protein